MNSVVLVITNYFLNNNNGNEQLSKISNGNSKFFQKIEYSYNTS